MSLMSQEAFAQALGVSFTTVNRWETGKSKPSYKALKMISEYCKANSIPFDVSKKITYILLVGLTYIAEKLLRIFDFSTSIIHRF